MLVSPAGQPTRGVGLRNEVREEVQQVLDHPLFLDQLHFDFAQVDDEDFVDVFREPPQVKLLQLGLLLVVLEGLRQEALGVQAQVPGATALDCLREVVRLHF